jgi:GNAT superfamily N-acetyltransferase
VQTLAQQRAGGQVHGMNQADSSPAISLRAATVHDVPVILRCIRGLAEYERLAHECVATDEQLRETLFGERPAAEVLLAEVDGSPAGFALYFHNYSTFLAQPGMYLEDLFVEPRYRGLGVGKALLSRLAALAVERRCGRLEWSVLDWNTDAIGFYEKLGARGMADWTVHRLTGDALLALAAEGSRRG